MSEVGHSFCSVMAASLLLLMNVDALGQSEWPPLREAGTTYPRTSTEIAKSIVPVDLGYPPGNALRYGAIGDGRADDTSALQNALDANRTVYFPKPKSKYRTDQLQIPSGLDLTIEEGTIIEANRGYGSYDVVFRIVDKSDVRISGYGATVRMLKGEYSGEFRHGVSIRGSRNVEVVGLAANDSGGDGFYIGAGALNSFAENVTLRDISADNNRRQGLSIVSGRNIRVINARLTNTSGTPPSAGIDIEPNDNTNLVENIVIEDAHTLGNQGHGITIYLNNLVGPVARSVSIRITNPVDEHSAGSFFVDKLDLKGNVMNGEIIIANPVSIESDDSAFTARNYDARGPRVEVRNGVAIRPNGARHSAARYGSAFVVYREASDRGAPAVGNVHFIEPEVDDDGSRPSAIQHFYVKDLTGAKLSNVTINGELVEEDQH